jgi:hypothetical protein
MKSVLRHWWMEREEQRDKSTGKEEGEDVDGGEGRGRSVDFKEARILMATTGRTFPTLATVVDIIPLLDPRICLLYLWTGTVHCYKRSPGYLQSTFYRHRPILYLTAEKSLSPQDPYRCAN